ncbi:shaker-related potassium channel tsha2-like [Branchiostoma floridae]|uniref:Shaker-related potassium channel tsha2-like n=2 Tax=Branchiostoma floridae TaxID=7739 RepID=A0A9J7LS37_BRAFL|nr:shaker-related potassium channel tsha2-like [Branchiostoma floridae]
MSVSSSSVEEDVFESEGEMAETDPLLPSETPLPSPPTTPREDRHLRLNVSGMIFETWESTLNRYPNTLLGDPVRRETFYCPDRDEYFFDRHRPSFEGIFLFYQRDKKATADKPGKMEKPLSVPVDIFYAEMKFFDIDEAVIKQCLEEEWYSLEEDPYAELPTREPQRSIWLLFDYPESSLWAKIIAVFSVSMIFLSIAVFCVGTMPGFDVDPLDSAMFSNGTMLDKLDRAYEDHLFGVETACIIWFCFELAIRFYASPNKCSFMKDIMNIFDIVAIVPFFVDFFMIVGVSKLEKGSSTSVFVRVLRLFRIFRILKLSRHVKGLQVLGKALFESIGSFILLSFFLCVSMTLFGSVLYFAEPNDSNGWNSIPGTFWYIIVTMTTVGYGDVYPSSLGGKLIGGVTVVCGIMTLSMPSPAIVTNFNKAWEMSKNVIATQDKNEAPSMGLWQRIRSKTSKKNGKQNGELFGYTWVGDVDIDKAKGRLWVTPKHYMLYGDPEIKKEEQKKTASSLQKYLYMGTPEGEGEFYV